MKRNIALAPRPLFSYHAACTHRRIRPPMPSLRLTVLALLALPAARPASATWLHCAAAGTDGNGPFVFETTVADLGPLPDARLTALRQRLSGYVTKMDTDARDVRSECYKFDDQLAAEAHYSHALAGTARRLGWEHVTVVDPESWLTDKEIINEPSRP